jgi:hypothetical protein
MERWSLVEVCVLVGNDAWQVASVVARAQQRVAPMRTVQQK